MLTSHGNEYHWGDILAFDLPFYLGDLFELLIIIPNGDNEPSPFLELIE